MHYFFWPTFFSKKYQSPRDVMLIFDREVLEPSPILRFCTQQSQQVASFFAYLTASSFQLQRFVYLNKKIRIQN